MTQKAREISHLKRTNGNGQACAHGQAEIDPVFMASLQSVLEPLTEMQTRGYLDGSVSGEVWKAFLEDARAEILTKLEIYRALRSPLEFCPASMGPYKDDLQKIQRRYIRDMAALYRQAASAYRHLAG